MCCSFSVPSNSSVQPFFDLLIQPGFEPPRWLAKEAHGLGVGDPAGLQNGRHVTVLYSRDRGFLLILQDFLHLCCWAL
jgi:hypothetical protein